MLSVAVRRCVSLEVWCGAVLLVGCSVFVVRCLICVISGVVCWSLCVESCVLCIVCCALKIGCLVVCWRLCVWLLLDDFVFNVWCLVLFLFVAWWLPLAVCCLRFAVQRVFVVGCCSLLTVACYSRVCYVARCLILLVVCCFLCAAMHMLFVGLCSFVFAD